MKNIDKIKEIIKKNNGIVSSKEVFKNNINTWYLTDMVRKGYIERVNRGVYFDPDFDNYDELYFFSITK